LRDIVDSLSDAILEIRFEQIKNLVEEALEKKDPLSILNELREGLTIVGDKYNAGEYFLSELYMAAETMQRAIEVLQPHLTSMDNSMYKGKIIIGSIEGDIHDIGKNIVSTLLTASGLTVIDMGVDISASRFVEEAVKLDANVIGISALLSSTISSSGDVVKELEDRGIRNKFKVILGGTGVPSDEAICMFGVDAAVNDGAEGVKIIKSWMEEARP
jgi:5-methyltetrahydrofolate--homocysteine methyltransferase